jgi:hypothetical protein
MIHAGLCTHVDKFGPLPFFGHTVDGNQNGRTAVNEQFALLRKHLPIPKLTMISDRGTFSAGHLLRLADIGGHALCSVRRTPQVVDLEESLVFVDRTTATAHCGKQAAQGTL